ncbi:hypothetical protein KAFR_0A01350 [Kazachstania africana CBS 2517]|uniref:SET domain-containing protein n=1 Tax=Kazachstania africana (strain ATCC 22294 / BCRC 22015 / CBS 2517 / CECT 1963 / NBRC 1671 / NRRL Y-8276) TaxID=1071382 RepID=H2AMH3_KAZAF|nr:hypothetical protein KAFR_0A01350 [Kazachstania africana CBS 2517]CCF55573.1 hypothetical protein KAFR_0A01350 [Kazachstania africana CBS 2517]
MIHKPKVVPNVPESVQLKLLEVREQIQKEQKQRDSLFNPMNSPGPASITLLQNSSTKKKKNNDSNNSNSAKHSQPISREVTYVKEAKDDGSTSNRGLVAAAALTAAFVKPFPHKQSHEGEEQDNDDDHNEIQTDRSFNNALPENYIVNKQQNIITCMCGSNGTLDGDVKKNDLIQCNRCNRWQHLQCYGLENNLEILPLKFFCNICKPNLSIENYKIDKKRIEKKRNKPFSLQIQIEIQNQLQAQTKGKLAHNIPSTSDSNNKNNNNNNINRTHFSSNILKNNSNSHNTTKTLREVTNNNTSEYEYNDKYVRNFIDDHNSDDWVRPLNKELKLSSNSVEVKNLNRTMVGVYAVQNFQKNDLIMIYPGLIDFQKSYIDDPENEYKVWGTTRRFILFHPHWPIFIDSRNKNSKIKYLRKSCQPNVELKTIKVDDTIKFVIAAIEEINIGDELTISWQWDLRHPIAPVNNDNQTYLESLNHANKLWLIHSTNLVSKACPCACKNVNSCKFAIAKKFTDSIINNHVSK